MTAPTDNRLEEALIDHVVGTDYADLPQPVVSYCKLLVMDTLGVSFPGILAPGVSEMIALADQWPCDSGATILGSGVKTVPAMAALVNSTQMHALDFDDTLDASALHTYVSVLPAALAAAESLGGINGRQLIAALVLGVDVICRISLAIRTPLSWIRTATCGGFGAAAAAGKILSLDREAMGNALGVVYGQTSGNAQGLIEGKLIKRVQPGFAAAAGVNAAFMAKSGITGSRQFLDGPYGYYRLYEGGNVDMDPVLDGLGSHYTLLDLSIKPYPCCRMTHSSIDAARVLGQRLEPDRAKIERIDVTVSKMVAEMVGQPFAPGSDPQVDAQFSIPYTVGCALVRGEVFLGDFEVAAIDDPPVRAMADRVHVGVDPNLPDKDLLHARVDVRLQNGRTVTEINPVPLGNPVKPMDRQKCRTKFKKCFRHSRLNMPSDRLEQLLSMIENLEQIEDVRQLIHCITVP